MSNGNDKTAIITGGSRGLGQHGDQSGPARRGYSLHVSLESC